MRTGQERTDTPSTGEKATEATSIATSSVLSQPISLRGFLKLVAAAAAAGMGQALARPRPAEASYIPGSPSDTVNTNLTVQGNLVVNQNVGIGTSTPAGRLEVAGEIKNGALVLLGSDGRGRQSYFSAGPPVTPPASTATGTWGRVKTTTWAAVNGGSWSQLQTMNGSWDQVEGYSWNQLLAMSWNQVTTL